MRGTRRIAVAAISLVTLVAGAGAAVAAVRWPTVTLTAAVSPNKAGTTKSPQGVRLTAALRWQKLKD